MYYTHPGCRTSIFGKNRAYCIRDFTVLTYVDNHNLTLLSFAFQFLLLYYYFFTLNYICLFIFIVAK